MPSTAINGHLLSTGRENFLTTVFCEIDEEDIDGVDSVCAYCTKCGHQTDSYGTDEASVLRCLALMREECPNNERNWYEECPKSDSPPLSS